MLFCVSRSVCGTAKHSKQDGGANLQPGKRGLAALPRELLVGMSGFSREANSALAFATGTK